MCHLFRTSTKAWITRSDQLYNGVQADDPVTISEPHAIKDSAQTKGVPACNSIFIKNLTFSLKQSLRDYVDEIKIT